MKNKGVHKLQYEQSEAAETCIIIMPSLVTLMHTKDNWPEYKLRGMVWGESNAATQMYTTYQKLVGELHCKIF